MRRLMIWATTAAVIGMGAAYASPQEPNAPPPIQQQDQTKKRARIYEPGTGGGAGQQQGQRRGQQNGGNPGQGQGQGQGGGQHRGGRGGGR